MTVDIHETDPDTGYSVAGHLLDEVRAAGDAGATADELRHLLGDVTSATVAQWLRELRVRGLVRKEPVSPGSTRVRWYAP